MNTFYKKTALIILALIILFGVGFGIFKISNDSKIKQEQYQAVFLRDGEVYFGKLQNTYGTYLSLNDVFYVKQTNTTENKNNESPLGQTDPQLIKRTDALHGPENTMQIKKSQVLYWENIREDSTIVKAILADQIKK